MGIILLSIGLSTGVNKGLEILLEPTDTYTTCIKGTWELQETGQYKCSSNDKELYCFKVSKSRCYIGQVKESINSNVKGSINNNKNIEICNIKYCK